MTRGDGRACLFHRTRLGPRVRQVKRSLEQSLRLRPARHCRALRQARCWNIQMIVATTRLGSEFIRFDRELD